MGNFPVKILAAAVLALWPRLVFGDPVADEAYENGIAAYKRKDYRNAYTCFRQVSDQIKQEALYHVWLGSTCKMIYDSDPKPENLHLLLEGAAAYKTSFGKNSDLHNHYNAGRMTVLYAIQGARNLIEWELSPTPLGAQLSAETGDTLLNRRMESALDSVKCLLTLGAKGLDEVWDTILERERRERLFVGPRQAISDTLELYLTFYAENSVKLLKTAYDVDFEGVQADYFIPKITAACRRGETSSDPQWFRDLLYAIQFDGGHNMRASVCRLIGRALDQEEKFEQSVAAFEKAVRYAQSDSSVASLYTDLAHIAYRVDLRRAVAYDRMAYHKNPLSQVIRDNYVGHSLNLALACLDQGRIDEAITHIQAVTLFRSNYQAEAFARLARACLKSPASDAREKAVKASREAYQLDPRYKQEYRDILVQMGRSEELFLLDNEKGQPAHPEEGQERPAAAPQKGSSSVQNTP